MMAHTGRTALMEGRIHKADNLRYKRHPKFLAARAEYRDHRKNGVPEPEAYRKFCKVRDAVFKELGIT